MQLRHISEMATTVLDNLRKQDLFAQRGTENFVWLSRLVKWRIPLICTTINGVILKTFSKMGKISAITDTFNSQLADSITADYASQPQSASPIGEFILSNLDFTHAKVWHSLARAKLVLLLGRHPRSWSVRVTLTSRPYYQTSSIYLFGGSIFLTQRET